MTHSIFPHRTALLAATFPAGRGSAGPGAAPPPESSLFSTAITRPTDGKNGYEDLVAAADLILGRPWYARVGDARLTLRDRRTILADPPCRKALALVQRGLRKPISSSRAELNYETRLPELAVFRSLGRVIVHEIYVRCADGDTAGTVPAASLGLNLGYAIQLQTLIHGLVGVAIETMVLKEAIARLPQLTLRDCASLLRVCLDRLDRPSSFVSLVRQELRTMQQQIPQLVDRARNGGVAEVAALLGGDPQSTDRWRGILDRPESTQRFVADAGVEARRVERLIEEQAARPVWERRFPMAPPELSPGAAMVWMLLPALQTVNGAFAREEAHLRLMATHVAVHAFRWQHGRLPATLPELRAGDFAVDPFTGGVLEYVLVGESYRLISAGDPTGEALELLP